MAERRPDPTTPDSAKTYTKDQFVKFYGVQQGNKMWKKGGRLLGQQAEEASTAELRFDPTWPNSRKQYTKQQFIEFYGPKRGNKMWKEAGRRAEEDDGGADDEEEEYGEEEDEEEEDEEEEEYEEEDDEEDEESTDELGAADWLEIAAQQYRSLADVGKKCVRTANGVLRELLCSGRRGPWCLKEMTERLRKALPSGTEVEPVAGKAQWVATVRHGPRVYVAMRTCIPRAVDPDLRRIIHVVRDTLLDHDMAWLHELQDSLDSLGDFIEACCQEQEGRGGGGGRRRRPDLEDCEYCGRSDTVAGRHLCTVWAAFRCPKCGHEWTSGRAKYSYNTDEMMAQDCARCYARGRQVIGDCTKHRRLDADDGEQVDGGGPHRPELCRTCVRYGDCRGVFYDPFTIDVSVQVHQAHEPRWEEEFRGADPDVSVFAEAGSGVVLMPHVYVEHTG
eukprot:TRINITY_DN60006_c0_g1_i1.p2 TRINITY_DN60006_c0_g1~~TRINITY_DN60006_c0_g1_i1.p2  ORF type:complete len:473 (+),score=131.75 TRINITY_DN60006_c0_g1_i1:80-1420(+)